MAGFEILDRGALLGQWVRVVVANLPRSIAVREAETARAALGLESDTVEIQELRAARGPGNVVMVGVRLESHTEVFAGFGERGLRAEAVASAAAKEARDYMASGVPVGRHLADQLLVPLALSTGGAFRTQAPTLHTTTNIDVIRRFLRTEIAAVEDAAGEWTMAVRS